MFSGSKFTAKALELGGANLSYLILLTQLILQIMKILSVCYGFIIWNEIRPGRASVQRQQEEYLGLKNKSRCGRRQTQVQVPRGLGQEITGFEWTAASGHRFCLPFASHLAVRTWVFRENPSRPISVGADHLLFFGAPTAV